MGCVNYTPIDCFQSIFLAHSRFVKFGKCHEFGKHHKMRTRNRLYSRTDRTMKSTVRRVQNSKGMGGFHFEYLL